MNGFADRLIRMLFVTDDRHLWRRVLAADLFLFNVAIFFFALLPPIDLNNFEIVALILSGFAAIGLVTHATDKITLPKEHLSYMITSSVGLYVFGSYMHMSTQPYYIKVPYLIFLLSGIVSGYAAHVIDGHEKKYYDRPDTPTA